MNLDMVSINAFKKEFIKCSSKDQTTLINRIENKDFGGVIYDEYYELKKRIITGYYTSEIGASKSLAYDAIPIEYIACHQINSLTKAWFTRY